jgi:hypothetical protein
MDVTGGKAGSEELESLLGWPTAERVPDEYMDQLEVVGNMWRALEMLVGGALTHRIFTSVLLRWRLEEAWVTPQV